MRGAIRIALASLLFTACASATSSVVDNGGAATALRAAAERTLRVESFHIDATYQMSPGSGPGTIDYQAPDREHERAGTGKNTNETISIGDTVYITANRPGYFSKIDGRGIGASDTLMYLHFLEHAENVRLDGHLYRFDIPSTLNGPAEGSTSGVATLTDAGFINTLLYHWQLAGDEVSVGFTYSRYNSGITVEPPPADRIEKPPSTPTCPPSSPSPYIDFCDVSSPTP
jgi:hypothetical protein